MSSLVVTIGTPMEEDTEVRHLSPGHRRALASILDTGDGWRELAAVLRRPDGQDGYLLTSSNIRILEQQKQVPGGSPTQALIDYWGTHGRKRPTISVLLETLVSCKLLRAADFVSVQVLGRAQRLDCDDQEIFTNPFAVLQNGQVHIGPKWSMAKDSVEVQPSAPDHQSSLSCDNFPTAFKVNNNGDWRHVELIANENHIPNATNRVSSNGPTAPIVSVDNVKNYLASLTIDGHFERFSYLDLAAATDNFAEAHVNKGGLKLGEGAFGSVYRADLLDNNGKRVVAVKVLKSDYCAQFSNEMSTMAKFNHDNLLPLLGISSDGPSLCLVFEFMVNGSLFAALSSARDNKNSEMCNQRVRMNIAVGAARGLGHLHTFLGVPLVHRDVKSDNILLDRNLEPKLGDFGLARSGTQGTGLTTSRNLTQNVIGTTVYMAPEAFRGDVSVKLDTFSFGVVLFELITGLKPYDDARDDPDLLSHVEEVVGEAAGGEEETSLVVTELVAQDVAWDKALVIELFNIARKATEQRKKLRPTMVELLPSLEELLKPRNT